MLLSEERLDLGPWDGSSVFGKQVHANPDDTSVALGSVLMHILDPEKRILVT